jgi:hypothetical protein
MIICKKYLKKIPVSFGLFLSEHFFLFLMITYHQQLEYNAPLKAILCLQYEDRPISSTELNLQEAAL